MVKVHLAVMLIGLGANQAFTSDDDRDRHWAEGVYFPPVTSPSGVQDKSFSVQPPTMRQVKRNPWPADAYNNSLNQPPTPQALGYPEDGYDPYRPSESDAHNTFPGQANEYVPKDYSPSAPNEYHTSKSRNGYRLNGFGNKEDHSGKDYRTDNYAQATDRYRGKRLSDSYRRDDESADAGRPGSEYRYNYNLKVYREPGSSNGYPSHERQKYSNLTDSIPYNLDWNADQFLDESRSLQIPLDLMWPLPKSEAFSPPW
jgi:hypothetical protein